ncbi:hypothetical protein CONLIGDRAFT_648597 [Coniochaeta ligniaria NRRL 30616]|uniref:Transmembrane protein n=1 Tax=Coniochaeta ligniaria NRRL 30616 TaxID=1408157 RepID=A0A1J7J3P0_9PEZI|nr:hypothetical protein CONLIGDRAFT_648597 [Coniochaeta ligniaria NRRL 30616]
MASSQTRDVRPHAPDSPWAASNSDSSRQYGHDLGTETAAHEGEDNNTTVNPAAASEQERPHFLASPFGKRGKIPGYAVDAGGRNSFLSGRGQSKRPIGMPPSFPRGRSLSDKGSVKFEKERRGNAAETEVDLPGPNRQTNTLRHTWSVCLANRVRFVYAAEDAPVCAREDVWDDAKAWIMQIGSTVHLLRVARTAFFEERRETTLQEERGERRGRASLSGNSHTPVSTAADVESAAAHETGSQETPSPREQDGPVTGGSQAADSGGLPAAATRPAPEEGRSMSDVSGTSTDEEPWYVQANHLCPDVPYIVVGIIYNDEAFPREVLLPIERGSEQPSVSRGKSILFKQIRKAERHLRPLWLRILSFKSVVGFSLYKCDPIMSSHTVPSISNRTQRSLAEMYRDYRNNNRRTEEQWATWVHRNFNADSCTPKHGKYALQLVLGWSSTKLAVWGATSILLSLAIGIWYMARPAEGEDIVAVVQTAWSLASYVVTTAALAIAVVGAVTQIGRG